MDFGRKDQGLIIKKEWMREFFETSSNPVGHGFSQHNLDQDFACYSFELKSNLPIKVIVLDDTQRHDDPNNPNSFGLLYKMENIVNGYKEGYTDK